MAIDDATANGKVTDTVLSDYKPRNSDPDGTWITRPINESLDEKIDRSSMGAMYELVYASLARRLREVMSEVNADLIGQFVHTAVNFRSINQSFFNDSVAQPTVPNNSGSGAGHYHSTVWGTNKDERLPYTKTSPVDQPPYAPGADVQSSNNRGLMVAKLFSDLESHLPLVLFNVASKQYVPVGIGGSSSTRQFFKDGSVVTELGYRVMLSVEAMAITEDDESTSNLQAIVEAAFGTLRDHVGTGAAITGSSWQLMLPTTLSPSPITEVDAPWSQGDDKGGKLYTATIGLENVTFESYNYVSKPVQPLLTDGSQSNDTLSITSGPDDDHTTTLQVPVGSRLKLTVDGLPLSARLVLSQGRKSAILRKPNQTGGFYDIEGVRTGEATIYVYDTGMTNAISSLDNPSSRSGSPLYQRKVLVSAV